MSGAGAGASASEGSASAVSNGRAAVPPKGALIRTTERKTSGRATAHHDATSEPKSCPARWTSR